MALVYIVEDDTGIREVETIALKNSGYYVQAFEKGSDFFRQLKEEIPDLVLMDVMLPDEDGCQIVRKLRKDARTRKIPIIMVTAKTSEIDMIKGLDDGADDYIRKPFSIMELLSRVKALLRRTQENEDAELSCGGITINHERHIVTVDGRPVQLTLKEYELLRYLMRNQNIVLSRDVIMRTVWETDFEGESRTVDMHIKTLRQKIGDYGRLIHTIRGVGYTISAEADDEA